MGIREIRKQKKAARRAGDGGRGGSRLLRAGAGFGAFVWGIGFMAGLLVLPGFPAAGQGNSFWFDPVRTVRERPGVGAPAGTAGGLSGGEIIVTLVNRENVIPQHIRPGGRDVIFTSEDERHLVWTGRVDSDWHNKDNWLEGFAPGEDSLVFVPDVSGESGRFPRLEGPASAGSLFIEEGAVLDLGEHNFRVGDIFINRGTLRLDGAAEQVLEGLAPGREEGTVEYGGAGRYTGLGLGNEYYGLSFGGEGTYVLDGPVEAAGILRVRSGVLDCGNQDVSAGGIAADPEAERLRFGGGNIRAGSEGIVLAAKELELAGRIEGPRIRVSGPAVLRGETEFSAGPEEGAEAVFEASLDGPGALRVICGPGGRIFFGAPLGRQEALGGLSCGGGAQVFIGGGVSAAGFLDLEDGAVISAGGVLAAEGMNFGPGIRGLGDVTLGPRNRERVIRLGGAGAAGAAAEAGEFFLTGTALAGVVLPEGAFLTIGGAGHEGPIFIGGGDGEDDGDGADSGNGPGEENAESAAAEGLDLSGCSYSLNLWTDSGPVSFCFGPGESLKLRDRGLLRINAGAGDILSPGEAGRDVVIGGGGVLDLKARNVGEPFRELRFAAAALRTELSGHGFIDAGDEIQLGDEAGGVSGAGGSLSVAADFITTGNRVALTGGSIAFFCRGLRAAHSLEVSGEGMLFIDAGEADVDLGAARISVRGGGFPAVYIQEAGNVILGLTEAAEGVLVLGQPERGFAARGSVSQAEGTALRLAGFEAAAGSVNLEGDNFIAVVGNIFSRGDITLGLGGSTRVDGELKILDEGGRVHIRTGGALTIGDGRISALGEAARIDLEAAGRLGIEGGGLKVPQGILRLAAGDGVVLTGGSIEAGALGLEGEGDFFLEGRAGLVAARVEGRLEYRAEEAFEAGEVCGLRGIRAGTLVLKPAAGLRLGAPLEARETLSCAGPVILRADVPVTAGGDIFFGADISGAVPLTVSSRKGNLFFAGTLGATGAPTGLNLEAARGIYLGGKVAAQGDIRLSAADVSVRGGILTLPGDLDVLHSGIFAISGDGIDLEGSFRQKGPGKVFLESGILTRTGHSVFLEGPLEAGKNARIRTAGGDITLGPVDSAEPGFGDLTLEAENQTIKAGTTGENLPLETIRIHCADLVLDAAGTFGFADLRLTRSLVLPGGRFFPEDLIASGLKEDPAYPAGRVRVNGEELP